MATFVADGVEVGPASKGIVHDLDAASSSGPEPWKGRRSQSQAVGRSVVGDAMRCMKGAIAQERSSSSIGLDLDLPKHLDERQQASTHRVTLISRLYYRGLG